MLYVTKIGIAAAVLLSALSMSQSVSALDIKCPTGMTATWNQAANGRTNTVQGGLLPIGFALPGPPVTTLDCIMSNTSTRIVQTVQFAVGTVASACGAQAAFSGPAGFVGLPPFGGVTFRSKRQRAIASYNAQTGVCRLEVPLFPLTVSVRMSAACEARSDGFRCPDNVVPVN